MATHSFTARKSLSLERCQKIRLALMNTDTWPSWNSAISSMLATDAGLLKEGYYLAHHSVLKGSLIESQWHIEEIREAKNFLEIIMLMIGQTRNEKPIAKGIGNFRLCITVLEEENGGVEIHSKWDTVGMGRLFHRSINSYAKKSTQLLLDDLCTIV